MPTARIKKNILLGDVLGRLWMDQVCRVEPLQSLSLSRNNRCFPRMSNSGFMSKDESERQTCESSLLSCVFSLSVRIGVHDQYCPITTDELLSSSFRDSHSSLVTRENVRSLFSYSQGSYHK